MMPLPELSCLYVQAIISLHGCTLQTNHLWLITLELSNLRLGVVKSSCCKPVTSCLFILKYPGTTAMFWMSSSSHITTGVTWIVLSINTRSLHITLLFIFMQNATHCISHYAIVVCVCLCESVCVCRVCGPQQTVWHRDVAFFKLRGITPDIICKSLTQIGLQIPWRRIKWRPWNTIIGCNSAIY